MVRHKFAVIDQALAFCGPEFHRGARHEDVASPGEVHLGDKGSRTAVIVLDGNTGFFRKEWADFFEGWLEPGAGVHKDTFR